MIISTGMADLEEIDLLYRTKMAARYFYYIVLVAIHQNKTNLILIT